MTTNHVSKKEPPRLPPGGLKLKDAAEYLGGLSTITLRRLVDRGLLRPNRALRHLVFSKVELDRFLESVIERPE